MEDVPKRRRSNSVLHGMVSISSTPRVPRNQKVRWALSKVIGNTYFDYVMGLVIMINMVMIIVETDHAAKHDGGVPWVTTMGWVILGVFVVELGMRLLVFGSAFFFDGWNLFDFFVVVTDLAFSVLGLIVGSAFPVSTLRIFRLLKLARVSKVFRVFPELRIMMAGLVGSLRSIFWGTVLLTFVLLVWSIIAVQFIHPLNEELADVHLDNGCERCPRAYESVLQSTLTFAQQVVAGDSWGQATIPLIEAYPLTAFFFLGVFLTVGMAVMNLILGVVVNVACSEHERLQGEMVEAASIKKMSASNGILSIIADHDADGDGELSMEELGELLDHTDFCAAVAEMGLHPEDLSHAFAVMDNDKSGTVTYVEFVKYLFKMKDPDASFMLEQLHFLIKQVKNVVIESTIQIQDVLTNQSSFKKFVQTEGGQRWSTHTNSDASDNIQVEEKVVETEMVRLEMTVPTNVSEQFIVNVTPPRLLAVPTSCGGQGDTKSTEQFLDAKYVGSLESRPTSLSPLTPHVDERDVLPAPVPCLVLSCSESPVPQGGQHCDKTEGMSMGRTRV